MREKEGKRYRQADRDRHRKEDAVTDRTETAKETCHRYSPLGHRNQNGKVERLHKI